MTVTKLNEILEQHLHWIREDIDGWERMKADLSRANLLGADLSRADLSRADLSGADLSIADLLGADLRETDLSRANLRGANLRGANLSRADLSGADLSIADLLGADLRETDLSRADLSRANLRGANLSRADLREANLLGADLYNVKIELDSFNQIFPICCPEYGSFIGWKKCQNDAIVKLEICEDAKRSSAYSRKCRCSAAKVLAIENPDGTPYGTDKAISNKDSSFIYRVGKIVKVDNFDENRINECSTGIHFFITRQEAVDYEF